MLTNSTSSPRHSYVAASEVLVLPSLVALLCYQYAVAQAKTSNKPGFLVALEKYLSW